MSETAKRLGIEKLYTVGEAAELLSVSARHLRNLIDDGELIVVRLGEGARADRIEESELKRFIMRRRINRGVVGVAECRSISVAKSGGSSFKSTASKLDSLLGPRKRTKH